MPEGKKHWGGALVKVGQNLPPEVGIGLTDLPNIGGATSPPAPPPVHASLFLIMLEGKINTKYK